MEGSRHEQTLSREEKLARWLATKKPSKRPSFNVVGSRRSSMQAKTTRSNSMESNNENCYEDKNYQDPGREPINRTSHEKRSRSLSEPPGSTRELIAELKHQNQILDRAEKDLSESFDRILKFKQDLLQQTNEIKNQNKSITNTGERQLEYVDKECQTLSFEQLLFDANCLGHAKFSVMAFANDYMHQEIKNLKDQIKKNKSKAHKAEKIYKEELNKSKVELELAELQLFKVEKKLAKLEAIQQAKESPQV